MAPGLPHEQVVFCEDADTGLRAIIGIHSTVLGPALGGTRYYPYADSGAALTDVLRLSRGMTYKAALAGVDLGGGKAVIVGDPTHSKTVAALRAYGRFVDTLGGRYITAGDIGIGAEDLDVIGGQTSHVVGRTVRAGGSGNSGPATALGVFRAMLAAAERVWGGTSLAGRLVGVEGLGKVGGELVELLSGAGARVVVTDVDPTAIQRIATRFPSVTVCDDMSGVDLDIYAPCALGATLTTASVARLTASIVCGAANNQLHTPDVEQLLHDRGVVWVPDYVANSGGLIQVAAELHGRDDLWVRRHVNAIYDTTLEILRHACERGSRPGTIADGIAEARLAAVRGTQA
nr:Glu/Leu/Phe/Val dehydrogenase dimerization domain-containing protein [Mycolicibacterium helvum]